MRELHLFAGIGGGILGGALLGHRCVAAVEIDRHCREVLLARQADGSLPPFPVFQSVRHGDREQRGLFDDPGVFVPEAWRGRVDVVAGGFPCQDVSLAGKRAGLSGARSGLWSEMVRTIRAVEPGFVFVENVPGLLSVNRGRDFGRVLGDLAELRFDAEWCVRSAADLGAPHLRKRLWILAAHADRIRRRDEQVPGIADGAADAASDGADGHVADTGSARNGTRRRERQQASTARTRDVAHADSERLPGQRLAEPDRQQGARGSEPDGRDPVRQQHDAAQVGDAVGPRPPGIQRGTIVHGQRSTAQRAGWWDVEPRVGRVVHGAPSRVDRLRALGNAQVPAVAASAFRELLGRLADVIDPNSIERIVVPGQIPPRPPIGRRLP